MDATLDASSALGIFMHSEQRIHFLQKKKNIFHSFLFAESSNSAITILVLQTEGQFLMESTLRHTHYKVI